MTTRSDLDALKEAYTVSPDVEKMNSKGNPAGSVINNPSKLKKLREKIGLPKESEADLDSWLEDCLTLNGWTWKHDRPARTKDSWRTAISGKKGFPDYPAARERDHRFILIETKSEDGKLSPDQQEWREILEKIPGIEYYLVRPSDRERIEEVLR